MPKGFPRHEKLHLADRFGSSLYKKGVGVAVADYFRSLAPNTILGASLDGVDTVSLAFLKEAIAGIRHHSPANARKAPMVAFSNASPEVHEDITLALSGDYSIGPAISLIEGSGVRLLSPYGRLQHTFETGKDLTARDGSFTAAQVAEALDISPSNANNRIRDLREAGAVTRWVDLRQGGSPKYSYRSITDEDALLCG